MKKILKILLCVFVVSAFCMGLDFSRAKKRQMPLFCPFTHFYEDSPKAQTYTQIYTLYICPFYYIIADNGPSAGAWVPLSSSYKVYFGIWFLPSYRI